MYYLLVLFSYELGNDCERKSDDTPFHWVGQKCPACGSYNTKITSTQNFPSTEQLQELDRSLRQAMINELTERGPDEEDDDINYEDEEENEDEEFVQNDH